jgi:glycosylphosphatidylinositol phospholipase D
VRVTNSCGTVESNAATLTVNSCPADYNGDGFVDGIDYDEFNNDFEAGNMRADYNGDGFVDGIDYDMFNNDFEAGC